MPASQADCTFVSQLVLRCSACYHLTKTDLICQRLATKWPLDGGLPFPDFLTPDERSRSAKSAPASHDSYQQLSFRHRVFSDDPIGLNEPRRSFKDWLQCERILLSEEWGGEVGDVAGVFWS